MMLKTKREFIDYCVAACNAGTFITKKHAASSLVVPQSRFRSVVCMDNPEMAAYLTKGDFVVWAYTNSDNRQSPDFYTIQPNDPKIVPGSGVPSFSTTPTSKCDLFAVPSGHQQGFHGFACTLQEVKQRESDKTLKLALELL